MAKTSDINLGKPFRFLFKGRPETRKTVSYASFPGRIYVFLFDPDGLNPTKIHFPKRDNIEFDFYNASNLETMDAKIRQLEQSNPFDLIVGDSLTFGADASMNYGLSKAKGPDTVGYVRLPGIREFNVEANIMLAFVSFGFRISDPEKSKACSFILTSHILEKNTYSPDGKITGTRKRLATGGDVLADKVLAEFKNVFHFDKEINPTDPRVPPKYIVSTVTEGDNTARTTLPLPAKMDITKDFLYDIMKRELLAKGVEI